MSAFAPNLDKVLSIRDLRDLARRRLPRSVFEFIDGGAEDELTLAENRAAFERVRLIPRILTDVSAPDIVTDIVGTPSAAPFVVAPMGSCMLAWPEADICIARAAAAHGIPYTLSTMSTTSIERMANAVQGNLWFQLYVLKDRDFNNQLVDRAAAAGYSTLVVAVDLQAGGKRERDLRNGVSIPLRMTIRHLWEGATHPGWSWQLARNGLPDFENMRGMMGSNDANLTIAARVGESLDASFNWDGLARLRERWPGKLMIKGVLHPEDAQRLVSLGIDGIWVSNHGGRQLDGAVASADALPAIAAAIGNRVPMIIDSGVRRGVDALKARVLGASAVAVGRAALYGAAAGGEKGARLALQILIEELRLAMKLAGTPSFYNAPETLVLSQTTRAPARQQHQYPQLASTFDLAPEKRTPC
ncbi:isopentenyl diphosphate isomerase/L-lactate dehydrogenase-like FMN-dependent dehydrogenase [Variovorax sp. GrIS 2.14]|uniref:alpha-hydroxy acid oxidase n=1 Tax=Variovorax sp. GrIS 2.14 TaxID=3071709 RepID=UPI0038F6ABF1